MFQGLISLVGIFWPLALLGSGLPNMHCRKCCCWWFLASSMAKEGGDQCRIYKLPLSLFSPCTRLYLTLVIHDSLELYSGFSQFLCCWYFLSHFCSFSRMDSGEGSQHLGLVRHLVRNWKTPTPPPHLSILLS